MQKPELRIMFLITIDQETSLGGAEKHLIELAGFLLGKDTSVIIVHDDQKFQNSAQSLLSPTPRLRFEYVKPASSDWETPRLIWKISRLIKQHQPDLIHAHKFKAAIISRLSAAISRRPIITTLQGSPGRWPINRYKKWFNIQLNRATTNHLTTAAIAVSNGERNDMILREKIRPEKITLIPNELIDPEKFQPTNPFSRKQTIITTVARLSPQKGHEDILQAAPKILAQKPDTIFYWIGDGELRSHLESEIKQKNLEQAVRFLGQQPPHEVARLLTESDIFLHPSHWEGLPYAMLEAAAAGLPIIATEISGQKELIDHGKNGWLIPDRSPDDIAGSVLFLINHHETARKLGQNARQRIMTDHQPLTSLKTTLALYKNLLKKKIMMVTTVGPTNSMLGGAERFLIDICQHLSSHAYNLIIVADNPDFLTLLKQKLPEKNIVYDQIRCRTDDFKDEKILWSLLRLIKKHRPDIIHAHKLKSAFWSSLAGKISRVKVITQQHSIPANWTISPLKKKVQNFLNGLTTNWLTDRAIAVSQEEKYAMIKSEKIKSSRIQVIYKGIFSENQPSAQPFNTKNVEIVAVGRLSREKGHIHLLKAVALLASTHPELHYTWIGAGPEKDQLEQEIKNSGLQQTIQLIGWQERVEVEHRLAQADIFILPSLWETLPYALGEAALAGLPIIASDIAGVRELVIPEKTGLLVPPENPEQLATAIEHVIKHPNEAREWGLSAARRARYLFNGVRMIRQLEQLYDEQGLGNRN